MDSPLFGNTGSFGTTQMGKSTGIVPNTVATADMGDTAIVALTPQAKDIGDKTVGHLDAAGHTHRIRFDCLDASDYVLKLNLLRTDSHDELIQRELIRELFRGAFEDLITRAREIDIVSSPLIREWIENAISLVLNQPEPVPVSWTIYALQPGHPNFELLVNNCIDREVQWKFLALPKSWSAIRRELGPALRLLEQTVGSPILRIRESFDDWLPAFLHNHGILIIEGGMVSEHGVRTVLSLIIIRIIQIVWEHFNRTGRKLNVLLIVDEFANHNLIAKTELSLGLNQCLKAGLRFHLISQGLPENEHIRDGIFHALHRLEVYRCSSYQIASFLAKELFTPILDPMKVHHVETRWRQVHDGYDRVEVTSENSGSSVRDDITTLTSGKSISYRDRPRYAQVAEELTHYLSLNDQQLLGAATLMNLHKRESVVRDFYGVRREYVPDVEEPWIFESITREQIRKARAWMRTLPEFKKAALPRIQNFGANETQRSLPSSETTRQPSRRSSKRGLSPLVRLARVGSKLSESEEK